MYPIETFNPIVSPTGIIDTHGVNKDEQIIFYNSSLACLELTFADQTRDTIPPLRVVDWIKKSPMGKIGYKTNFVLPMNGQPNSIFYGTLYEQGEHKPSINDALQYINIIGNTGAINVSAATSLVNNSGVPNNIVNLGTPSDPGLVQVNADGSGQWYTSPGGGPAAQLMQILASLTNPIKFLQGFPASAIFEIATILQVDGKINNSFGLVPATVVSGYQFATNDSIASGATKTYQITGNGTVTIPSTAIGVFIVVEWTGDTAGGFIVARPQAGVTGVQFPLMGVCTVPTVFVSGSGMVPLNTSNGQIDLKVTGCNATAINGYVYAFKA